MEKFSISFIDRNIFFGSKIFKKKRSFVFELKKMARCLPKRCFLRNFFYSQKICWRIPFLDTFSFAYGDNRLQIFSRTVSSESL